MAAVRGFICDFPFNLIRLISELRSYRTSHLTVTFCLISESGMLLEFWLVLVLSWNPWKFRYWTTGPDRPWLGWPMSMCKISPIPFEHSNPHSVQIKFECASKILNKFLSWYSQVDVKCHVSNDIIFKRGTFKNLLINNKYAIRWGGVLFYWKS